MELHPFLEKSICPNEGLWYVLNATGDCPTSRWVGACCVYKPNQDGFNGKVYVVGGTDPGGCFSGMCVLDLEDFTWSIPDTEGLMNRYEHTTFLTDDQMFVYGGANQQGNHNSVQSADLRTLSTWSTLSPGGASPPSARTYHCMGALKCQDSYRFTVYSGGQVGSEPVRDKQVHVYDTKENQWLKPEVKGTPPKSRHGHLVISDSAHQSIIIHGGMAGTAIYDDLHILKVKEQRSGSAQWKQVEKKRGQPWPSARAAHAGAIYGSHLYIFGGMNKEGSLDDLWKLNLETFQWSCCMFDGPPPSTRLDHCCCIIKLSVPPPGDLQQDHDDLLDTTRHAHTVMDTQLRLGSASSLSSSCSERSYGSSSGNVAKESERKPLEEKPASANKQTDGKIEGERIAEEERARSPSNSEPLHSNPAQQCTTDSSSSSDSGIVVTLLMVLGGMDTMGNVFDDCLLIRIE